MRVLLFGCGAIGGVIAASLLRAGAEVTLVTGNPEITAAIGKRGLSVVELDEQKWAVVPRRPVVTKAAELAGEAPFELCLLCTKTTALASAVRDALPLLTPDAALVCMQNGLPEERVASDAQLAARLLGCVVGFGASLGQVGQSRRTSAGGLTLGRAVRFPGQPPVDKDLLLQQAAGLLRQAFPVRIEEDLQPVRWSKLAINCATSTLGAAGGDTLGRLLRHRFVRRLALEIWSELSAVAERSGIKMAKVAGTLDIGKLALSAGERRARLGTAGLLYKHSLLFAVGLKFRRMRSSMLVAIERGRTPEIDWLNGEVVRRGAALGIATPVNAALWRLIHDIVGRREQPGLATLHGLYQRLLAGELPPSYTAPGERPEGRPAASATDALLL